MHPVVFYIVLVQMVSMCRGDVSLNIDKSVVCEGTSVTLTCTVDPLNYIIWRRNGVRISSCSSTCDQRSGYNIDINTDTGISIVYINNTSSVRDAGEWTCITLASSDTRSTNLKITAPSSSTIQDKSRLLFTDGMVTDVTCSTGTTDSTVSYTWYIDSTDNTVPGRTSVINGSPASILQLTSTKQLNNKTLYCSATNQCGTGNTDNITLDITYGPNVSLPNELIYKAETESLSISCSVDSNPVSTIRWYGPDGRVVSNNKDLVINNIHRNQSGIYNCTAITVLQNTNGNQQIQTDSRTVLVTIGGEPDQPRDFKLVRVTQDSICVELQPGFNNGDVQEFIFEYSLYNIVWYLSATVNERGDKDVEHCFNDLDANTVYYIRVIAKNRFGQSQPLFLVTAKPIRTYAARAEAGDDDNGPYIALGVCLAIAITVSIIFIILVIKMRCKLRYFTDVKTAAVANGDSDTRETSTYDSLELNTRSESPPSTYNNLELNRTTETLPSTYVNLDEQPTN